MAPRVEMRTSLVGQRDQQIVKRSLNAGRSCFGAIGISLERAIGGSIPEQTHVQVKRRALVQWTEVAATEYKALGLSEGLNSCH